MTQDLKGSFPVSPTKTIRKSTCCLKQPTWIKYLRRGTLLLATRKKTHTPSQELGLVKNLMGASPPPTHQTHVLCKAVTTTTKETTVLQKSFQIQSMAQSSRICHGVQNPCVIISNLSKSNQNKSPFSVSLKTHQPRASSWGLKKSGTMLNGSVIRPVKVTASVSTSEKASEIVLQPIREISGLIKLPGSKSLSNRILLLAALSEVHILAQCQAFAVRFWELQTIQ